MAQVLTKVIESADPNMLSREIGKWFKQHKNRNLKNTRVEFSTTPGMYSVLLLWHSGVQWKEGS